MPAPLLVLPALQVGPLQQVEEPAGLLGLRIAQAAVVEAPRLRLRTRPQEWPAGAGRTQVALLVMASMEARALAAGPVVLDLTTAFLKVQRRAPLQVAAAAAEITCSALRKTARPVASALRGHDAIALPEKPICNHCHD